MSRNKRIGIIAGEPSGDILGAALIQSIQTIDPSIRFEGIAGPKMLEVGCHSLFPMERLSVMGISEVLKRLPEILRIRKSITQHFINNPPDLFIGIDSPDFNLGVELKLRKKNIPTIHYVSPTVWAWRQGRVKKIAKACSHLLALFPFEAEFYVKHNVPVTYVGHPLADQIPLMTNQLAARQQLKLSVEKKLIAILPGSREAEVSRLGSLFLEVAEYCLQQRDDLQFVIPCINEHIKQQLEAIWFGKISDQTLKIILGDSHLAMQASDVVLLASGTATLEAMLFKKPMVVAYQLAPFSYWLGKKLIKVPFIALPNLLANKKVVPEFIQEAAKPQDIATAVLAYLAPSLSHFALKDLFMTLHQNLRHDASKKAAEVVVQLIGANGFAE